MCVCCVVYVWYMYLLMCVCACVCTCMYRLGCLDDSPTFTFETGFLTGPKAHWPMSFRDLLVSATTDLRL